MIVWITHVKVGHHQTPYTKTPVQMDGGFILCDEFQAETFAKLASVADFFVRLTLEIVAFLIVMSSI